MSSDCLEYCREARGLGHTIFFAESPHRAAAAEVAVLMTTRIETFKDVLGLVCAYEARDSRQSQEERWNAARDTLQDALEFFEVVQYSLTVPRDVSRTRSGTSLQSRKPIFSGTTFLAASGLEERATRITNSAKCFKTAHHESEFRHRKKGTGIG